MRAARLAAVVIAAALLAGCGARTSPAAVSSGHEASAPNGAVVPETAGKPVLRLRMGQPVVYHQGLITLTITGDSVERADYAEIGAPDREDCRSVWTTRFTVRVQAPSHGPDDVWLAKGFKHVYPVRSVEPGPDGTFRKFGTTLLEFKEPDGFIAQLIHENTALVKDDGPYDHTYRAALYSEDCDPPRQPGYVEPSGTVLAPAGLAAFVSTPDDQRRGPDAATAIAVWTR